MKCELVGLIKLNNRVNLIILNYRTNLFDDQK